MKGGYVLTYKMTLGNKSDEDVYYSGGVSLLSEDGVDYIIPRKHLVDKDEWLKDDSTENASRFSCGAFLLDIFLYLKTN